MTGSMQQTQEGQVLGTPQVHEPRAGSGQGPRSSHSTSSVMGVVLYELTTGQKTVRRRELRRDPEQRSSTPSRRPSPGSTTTSRPSWSGSRSSACRNRPTAATRSARELMVDLRNLARELEHGPAASGSATFGRLEPAQDGRGKSRRDRGRAVFAGEAQDQRRAA